MRREAPNALGALGLGRAKGRLRDIKRKLSFSLEFDVSFRLNGLIQRENKV